MALDESISDDDMLEEIGGIKFVFSKQLSHLMDGVTIDYAKTWFGRQLTINSPYGGAC